MLKVAALVSAGRDPYTARPRRARADARALEAGLGLPGATLTVVHAGSPEEPSLFEYLGMGPGRIVALPTSGGAGLAAGLASFLSAGGYDLVLAGEQAETGEGSGCLPYALADRLGVPIVPGALAVTVAGGRVSCVVRGAGRRRRIVEACLPAIATVACDAPTPRPFAYVKARDGKVDTGAPIAAARPPDPASAVRRRLRPKRLPVVSAPDAWQRIRQIIDADSAGGEIFIPTDPDRAARRLLEAIARAGVWRDTRSMSCKPMEEAACPSRD